MPGKRVTRKQLEQGIEFTASALQRPTGKELAGAMNVSVPTALKYQPMLEQLVMEYQQVKGGERAEKIAAVEHLALTRLADSKLWEEARLRDIGVVYGILHDKMALASGRATSHVHVLHEITTREQLARRLAALPGFLDTPDVVGGRDSDDGHGDGTK